MKKLFTLLFAAALAISLAMPVFAQDTSAPSSSSTTSTSTKKEKKSKPKKEKKSKEPKSETATPPSQ